VIATPILVEFWTKHPAAEPPLESWYRTMKMEVFADFNDLRVTFASADYVDGLTVFNIGGNKYRLKQEDLNDCAPQSRISDILSGNRGISRDVAKKLARRFNVSTDLFL